MNNAISSTAVRAYKAATGDVNFVLVSLDADDNPADVQVYTSKIDAEANAATVCSWVIFIFEDDEPQIWKTDSPSTRHLASYERPLGIGVEVLFRVDDEIVEVGTIADERIATANGPQALDTFRVNDGAGKNVGWFTASELTRHFRPPVKAETSKPTSMLDDMKDDIVGAIADGEAERARIIAVMMVREARAAFTDEDGEPDGVHPTDEMKQAIRLILTLDDHPWNSPETIELCEASRAQLIGALAAAGETYEPPARSRYDFRTVSPESVHGEPVDDNDPAHLLIGADGLGTERYPATAGPSDLEIEDAHAINEDDTFDEAPKSSHVRDLRSGDVITIVGERANGVDYSMTLTLVGKARELRAGRLFQIMGTSLASGTLLAMEQFFDDDTDPEFCAVRVCTFVDQSGQGLPAKRRTLLREGLVTRINGDPVDRISFSQ